MPIYRRRKGGDTWHWCTNCSRWPTLNYDKSFTKPSGELCNECNEKARERICRKL